jgi:hypothetical protein
MDERNGVEARATVLRIRPKGARETAERIVCMRVVGCKVERGDWTKDTNGFWIRADHLTGQPTALFEIVARPILTR